MHRIDQKQTEQPLPTPRLTNSSLATLSYSSLKDSTTTFAKESMEKKIYCFSQHIYT